MLNEYHQRDFKPVNFASCSYHAFKSSSYTNSDISYTLSSLRKVYFSIYVPYADDDLTLWVINISTQYRSFAGRHRVYYKSILWALMCVYFFLQRLKAYLIFLGITYDEA
jgi:hypothetical protein